MTKKRSSRKSEPKALAALGARKALRTDVRAGRLASFNASFTASRK